MKIIALLGPTASGKTALSIELALKHNALILSLDSLSIYKEIDIASAKPSLEERGDIFHFGIDEILPSEPFNVTMFFELFHKAKNRCLQENKNLIIVGGTGFYLKAMMDGLSVKPVISDEIKDEIEKKLYDLPSAYKLMQKIDALYAQKISPNDRYRIEKWLELYISTNEVPSRYLQNAKKEPILSDVGLFEIAISKDLLAKKIALRTEKMVQDGLIVEIFGLEKRYTRAPQCMKAIGIKEVLDFFDGKYKLAELKERISFNTLHLAKRQRTFNTTQFQEHPTLEALELKKSIDAYFCSK